MKKKTKEVGGELHPGKGVLAQEGSLKKRELSKHQEILTAESVASLGSTEGNITGKRNK